jgi:hypothetical protein
MEKVKTALAAAWSAVQFLWAWVVWLWGKYEGLIHDYPRGAAIAFAAYIAYRVVRIWL